MARQDRKPFETGNPIDRRRFLQLTAGGAAWLSAGIRPAFAAEAPYRVAIIKSPNPYPATRRAVEKTGEWPSAEIVDKTVVIKPNLVVPMTADTGVTTDPEVVRALVDLALEDGAAEVCIVEGGYGGPNFSGCGYDFFSSYDPRVRLVDLNDEPLSFVDVPGAMAYEKIYMPTFLLGDNVVLISAAKMKTHMHTHATLSMKNLMGLPPVERYRYPQDEWRFGMHDRGLSQVIVDLNVIRPIDFAVVDGIWAMEGEGPVSGDLVDMKKIVAGRNALAVDRVCLDQMEIPQNSVMHLSYAARKGLGPQRMSEIRTLGRKNPTHNFTWPADLPPRLEYPRVYPDSFAPDLGQQAWIFYWVDSPCLTKVEIIMTSELTPLLTSIRTLHDWEERAGGFETLTWDGRDDNGEVMPPQRYTVRVAWKNIDGETVMLATGWIRVT